MKIRAAVLSSLLAVGLVASTSTAAPVCNLLQDPKGDVAPVGSDNLDLISADLASDAKQITAVIRTVKTADSESTAPTGFSYNLRFTAPGYENPLYFLATVGDVETGTTFEYGFIDGSFLEKVGDAKGVIDEGKSEIRMTAPVAFGGLVNLKPGLKLTTMRALAYRTFVVLLSTADSTAVDSPSTYTTGTQSCVKVGE